MGKTKLSYTVVSTTLRDSVVPIDSLSLCRISMHIYGSEILVVRVDRDGTGCEFHHIGVRSLMRA